MASPIVQFRCPPALLALIDAEAERTGRTRSDVVLADVEAARAGFAEEAHPGAPVYPTPTPKAERARAAARVAQAKTGVAVTTGASRARAAMEAAGTVEWDPNAKRTPYQKAARPAPGKGRR
jgi:hypothetical protein